MSLLPCFSVIVPTRNRPRQLGACLAALTRLDYPRDRFEVLVVNDGGDAPMDEVIEATARQITLRVLTTPHAGPGLTRNTGAKAASGDFLAFTDDDCEPLPDWLSAFARHARCQPAALLGGLTLNALPGNRFAATSQILVDYLYAYYNTDAEHARFFTSNNLAVPAERFREIGGFDPIFVRAAAEDRDLSSRWFHAGFSARFVADARVRHSHDLDLRGFLRQHFGYGRGALYFRRRESERTDERVRVEPPSFYGAMLRLPFQRMNRLDAPACAALLAITQAANAAGFFWERFAGGPVNGIPEPTNGNGRHGG